MRPFAPLTGCCASAGAHLSIASRQDKLQWPNPRGPLRPGRMIKEHSMDAYTGTYEVRWSDLDANGHVNYAAYIDAAGDLRY